MFSTYFPAASSCVSWQNFTSVAVSENVKNKNHQSTTPVEMNYFTFFLTLHHLWMSLTTLTPTKHMHWTSHVSPCVFRLLVLRECGAHLCSLLPHFASSRLSTTNALILFTSSCDSCMLRCEKILVMELVTHHELGSEGLCHVSNMSENKKLEITNTSCKGVVMKHETMGAAVSEV